jgi:hypothetical protein
MISNNITEGQITAFARSLIDNGIIDKSQVSDNKDLMAEALRISQTREGITQVMYNYTQPTGSELNKTPAINPNNG